MFGDNGVLVDFEEMVKAIATADVFLLGFGHFNEGLLVDARSNEREAPLIQVVEPTGSAADHLSWLYRTRPSLGRPQSLTFRPWPHSPSFLVQSGVWGHIRDRVGAETDAEVRALCDLAMRQLQNLQVSATQALLKGELSHDLWPHREVPEARV